MSYHVGDRVTVVADRAGGNPRTPRYLREKTGTVAAVHGVVENPLDHRDPYPPLYTVVFELESGEEVTAEIHEEWLLPALSSDP